MTFATSYPQRTASATSSLFRLSVMMVTILILASVSPAAIAAQQDGEACAAVAWTSDLTILSAGMRTSSGGVEYCYVRGVIGPAIGFHVQLPVASNWNGRFLMWGDGGKDGDLDLADERLEEGYAVANTNMGHDGGAEPGSSFGFDNRAAEIDFGYRAVHLTTVAAKSLVASFYDRPPEFSYFEGCSTGGREGLMEAQRFPEDFDGIVAGAPAHLYQDLNVARTWLLQKMYADNFAGSLSFDTNGDGRPDSARKLEMLAEAVLDQCDAIDGVEDGVINDPVQCGFDPQRDLASMMCPGDANAEACFTRRQIGNVVDFYRGAYDGAGNRIYPGHALGSEDSWLGLYVPHRGNGYQAGALGITADHLNYLFYEQDPGVAPSDLTRIDRSPNRSKLPPEWGWWEFDINDVAEGKGDLMKSITDAADANLAPFLIENGGKLLLYHGWADALIVPFGTVEYYDSMLESTFDGDRSRAAESVRLFMIPGMGHCSGGPGPNQWDKLAPLVEWVERGQAPDRLVAEHRTRGEVDNQRPIFPYPAHTVYSGPPGGASDRANWTADNFRSE